MRGRALNRKEEIRVLTYNIWFERTEQRDRIDSIIQVILDADADFVCLQEVIGVTRQLILENLDI